MFRVSRSFARLQGLPRRPALTAGTRPHQPLVPISIVQRVGFASKKDDKADPPPPKQPIDYERERELGQRKLEARPSEVSTKSSTTNELKTPVENTAGDPILQNELKHDMGIIKETFSLDNVPHESKVLGLAGTIPYFATSLSTIYLSWDLKQTVPTGNSLYDAIAIDHGTAQYLLSIVEPVQLGYGAVIISFLGAIHWGLEYAEKKPHPGRTRFRYGMGLIAPIVAWPTLIMPVPYALTTQFLAFVGLYFADARATTRGWAPTWYGSYRFMLTAIVGVTLFISLVGRQKMTQGNALTQEGLKNRLEQTGNADHETDWAKLEEEERERRRKEKAEAEKKAKKEAAEKKKKSKDSKKSKDGKSDDGKASDSKKNDDEEDDSKHDKAEDSEGDKADEKDDSEDKDNGEDTKEGDKGGDDEDKNGEKEDKEDDKQEDEKTEKKDDNKKDKKADKKADNKADKKEDKKEDEKNGEDGDNDEQKDDEAESDSDEDSKKDGDSQDKKGKDDGDQKDDKKDEKKSDKKSGSEKGKKK